MEETYSESLAKILHSARGPLSDITEFTGPTNPPQKEIIDDGESSNRAQPIGESDVERHISERSQLRRLAALMAVISMNGGDESAQGNVGRMLGSSWAQDHRRQALGLNGLAYSRAKRARWR